MVLISEVLEEFYENLIGSHISINHLWMMRTIVHSSEIIGSNKTIGILIELEEGNVNVLLSAITWSASDRVKELVKVNMPIAISVQTLKQNNGLSLGNLNLVVPESPVELLFIDFPVAIVVQDLEGPAEPSQSLSTLSYTCSNFVQNCYEIDLLSTGSVSSIYLILLIMEFGRDPSWQEDPSLESSRPESRVSYSSSS